MYLNKQGEMRKGNRLEVSPFFGKKKVKTSGNFKKFLKRWTLGVCLILSFFNEINAQEFKVIGYLPSYRFHLDNKIEY